MKKFLLIFIPILIVLSDSVFLYSQIHPENIVEEIKEDGKIISVDFKNVPIEDVLRVLSLQQNVNIIFDQDVSGNISIHLNEISFEKALKFITSVIGCDYKFEEDVYKVFVQTENTKETEILNFKLEVTDGKINLVAHNIDIKILLQKVALKSGLNVIFDNSVSGNTSIAVKNLPVNEGLISLIETNGFVWEKIDDVFRVSKDKIRNYIIEVADKKVSINAREGNLKDILKDLSLQSGLNIVTCGYVTGNVNCRLVDCDPETIIKFILMGTNYQYRKIDDVYIIGDADSLTVQSIPFISNEVIKLSHLKAKDLISKLPPTFPTKNVQFIEGQNAISISGSEELVNSLKNYIKKIDKPVPQINIEVLVVEYKENMDKSFGLSLEDVKGKGFGSKSTTFNFKPGQSTPFDFSYDLATSLSKAFKFYLQAMVEEGKAKICANPNISTLNGKNAVMSVLTKDRYREHRYNRLTNAFEPLGEPREIETGIKMKIKPWVTGENEITVLIEPEVSEATGNYSSDNLPQTNERKAKTMLKVKSGKTIVIGGLIQSTYENKIMRTPVLSKIPVLGEIFKKRTKQEVRTELVFYITPTINPITEEDKDLQVEDKQSYIKKLLDEKETQKGICAVVGNKQEQQVLNAFKRLLGAETLENKKEMKTLSDQVEKFGWDAVLNVNPNSGFDVVFDTEIETDPITQEKTVQEQYTINEPLPEDEKYQTIPEYQILNAVVDKILNQNADVVVYSEKEAKKT